MRSSERRYYRQNMILVYSISSYGALKFMKLKENRVEHRLSHIDPRVEWFQKIGLCATTVMLN